MRGGDRFLRPAKQMIGVIKLKASEIFSRALALLNEDESRARGFKKNAVLLINQLLAQCLSVENSLRESKGNEELECAQVIEKLEDEICYEQNFVCECMAYGLAALLCADDDKPMSNAMGEEFERLKRKYMVAQYQDITNHY